jgi:hypothetical protein
MWFGRDVVQSRSGDGTSMIGGGGRVRHINEHSDERAVSLRTGRVDALWR